MRRTRWIDFEKAKFAEVSDEDQAVLLQIAERLGFGSEGVQVVVGGLDLDRATLRIPKQKGFGGAGSPRRLWEETTIGHTCPLAAELGGEEDLGFEGLSSGVEEAVEGRIERSFGGGGAGVADGTEVGDILGDGVSGGHVASMIACEWRRR